jgi:hypothetical protein
VSPVSVLLVLLSGLEVLLQSLFGSSSSGWYVDHGLAVKGGVALARASKSAGGAFDVGGQVRVAWVRDLRLLYLYHGLKVK